MIRLVCANRQAVTWFARMAATVAAATIAAEIFSQTNAVCLETCSRLMLRDCSASCRACGPSSSWSLLTHGCPLEQGLPATWIKHRRFAKLNCAVAAALLAAMFALLGVLAHRLVTLARQGKQWTQRRVRLTGIHALLVLLQVSAVRTQDVTSETLLLILDRLRRADACCHKLTAAWRVVQVPSNVLYLGVNAWTLAGYCRLHGALIDWFKYVPTISALMP